MKVYEPENIKNVILLGHAGSGKTTLAETMLFEAGAINRRGAVEDHNTVSDYQDIEHEREYSISGSLLHVDWRDTKINIIEAPGNDEVIGEVVAGLKVADTGLLLLNAQYGVEVGSEIAWEYAAENNTPIIIAINQVDHDKAEFDKVVDQAKASYGNKVTVVQYPINPGHGFNAIIDVLKMVMYKFPADGGKPEKAPIPDSEKEKAEGLHNELVEAAAESDEELMELFFEKGTLDEDEMRKGLRLGLVNRSFFPVFCLSSKKNMGSGRLMGFIQNVAPTAADLPPAKLTNGEELPSDTAGKPVLFIYKTVSEQHLGDMSFFKVCSGELKVGMDLVNEQTDGTERFNQMYGLVGNKREGVEALKAGDIGATVKLKNTHTNNTLHLKGHDVAIEPIQYPEPLITLAIEPTKKGDEEKVALALNQIHEQDLTIIAEHSPELKQLLVHGQGELHLNMVKWRLENIYKVNTQYIKPRIPYRETIQKAVSVSYRHKKQTGGAGQFAEVHMLVEPYSEDMPPPKDLTVRNEDIHDLKWGGHLAFLNCIVGGSIDARFMPSILKGVMEKMVDGPLTGSYVRDVRVSIFDGKMHPVDSNDAAFKTAGRMAFRNAFHDADPKILEPVYEVEVKCPEEIMGDVMSDMQTRRATILGMEAEGTFQKIKAKVPLAELYKYSSALRSISQGRAKHKQRFAEYSQVPFDLQQKLIETHKEELQEA